MRQARDLIENFRPEKFPALAVLVEGKTDNDLTALEQTVVLFANDFRAAAETSAAELSRLQAIEQAAREVLVCFMVTDEWGDTDNTPCYESARSEIMRDKALAKLAAALKGE